MSRSDMHFTHTLLALVYYRVSNESPMSLFLLICCSLALALSMIDEFLVWRKRRKREEMEQFFRKVDDISEPND